MSLELQSLTAIRRRLRVWRNKLKYFKSATVDSDGGEQFYIKIVSLGQCQCTTDHPVKQYFFLVKLANGKKCFGSAIEDLLPRARWMTMYNTQTHFYLQQRLLQGQDELNGMKKHLTTPNRSSKIIFTTERSSYVILQFNSLVLVCPLQNYLIPIS